jgi:hypothetical protein
MPHAVVYVLPKNLRGRVASVRSLGLRFRLASRRFSSGPECLSWVPFRRSFLPLENLLSRWLRVRIRLAQLLVLSRNRHLSVDLCRADILSHEISGLIQTRTRHTGLLFSVDHFRSCYLPHQLFRHSRLLANSDVRVLKLLVAHLDSTRDNANLHGADRAITHHGLDANLRPIIANQRARHQRFQPIGASRVTRRARHEFDDRFRKSTA